MLASLSSLNVYPQPSEMEGGGYGVTLDVLPSVHPQLLFPTHILDFFHIAHAQHLGDVDVHFWAYDLPPTF